MTEKHVRSINDALDLMESPDMTPDVKWNMLAFILREICNAQGIDRNIKTNADGEIIIQL